MTDTQLARGAVTHTYEDSRIGIVDIVALWCLTSGAEVKLVPVVHLDQLLDIAVWENETEDPNVGITPRQVLANPEQFASHWARINRFDEHPILVLWPDGAAWPTDVIDGMHRLAHASRYGLESIAVRVVTVAQLESARPVDGRGT